MAKMFYRRMAILAKTESSYGVDAAPAPATNAVMTRDLEITPLDATRLERQLDKPTFGSDYGTLVGKMVRVKFKVEMAGAGGAADAIPAWGPLMVAAGHTETVTATTEVRYTPQDTGTNSVTIKFYQDKMLHTLLGCRGKLVNTGKMKEYGYFEFEFIGLYSQPAASTLPSGLDYTAFTKPLACRASTVSATLFGTTVEWLSHNLNGGQDVGHYETSEAETIEQFDRQANMDLTIVEPEVGTLNIWSYVDNETAGVFLFTLGTATGNIVEVKVPNYQILDINRSDEQGVMALNLSGPCVPDGAADYEIATK